MQSEFAIFGNRAVGLNVAPEKIKSRVLIFEVMRWA